VRPKKRFNHETKGRGGKPLDQRERGETPRPKGEGGNPETKGRGGKPLDQRERGLSVLRKSRTRQLTYGSGAEPQHRDLGQHLFNSQSSIGSGQDGDELRLVQTFDQRLIATRPEWPYILRPYSHSEERPNVRGQSAGCFLATPPRN